MSTRPIAAAYLVVWVLACTDAIGPPSDAIRFTPPARYRGWWSLVERCSGRTGDLNAVRWYVLPNNSSFPLEGQAVNGAFYPAGMQIVLGAGFEESGPLVRHEMLHALMPTTPGHPREQFLDRCGDIVVCADRCVSDAGGPPDWPATAPIVPANSLTVGIVLAPNPVSRSADSGWLPLTVTATNGAAHAVRVAIPIAPAGAPPATSFSYRIAPVAGGPADSVGFVLLDGSFLVLAPAGTAGATRRVVFDNFPTVQRVLPGDYNATGIFLGVASTSLILHVKP